MKRFFLSVLALAALVLTSCDRRESADKDGGLAYTDGAASFSRPGGSGGGQGGGGSLAGKVTAGEWNDLAHWAFWSNLMLSRAGQDQGGEAVDFPAMCDYWRFYTNNRVAVSVKSGQGTPVAGARVLLTQGGQTVWKAVTDNAGRADLWVSLFQKAELQDAQGLALTVNDEPLQGAVKLTPWDATADVALNEVVVSNVPPVSMQADIAFIVDATGSMSDEIAFLKADLLDVLKRTSGQQIAVALRTAAVFYRDQGDDYLTRGIDFSTDPSNTVDFIRQQYADGGGDYPEAVHTALEVSLSELSWDEGARTRLAFMLLDAPAHQDVQGVVESLQKSIRTYAAKGIRLIPVASSGVDKYTEFMLRFFAISTGGTYVFLTNDSGIGGDHITATVGEYKVELLSDLLVRLIGEYTK